MPAPRFRSAAAPAFLLVLLLALPARASTSDLELTFPQDVAVTEFTSSWGASRSGGRSHQGNDLMAPKMTPVYAAATGVVSRIDEGSMPGRWLTIDHAGGWQTLYMHLNNDTPGTDDGRAPWSETIYPGLAEGMTVLAGTLIGWVGDSGNAEWTGSHTHFELHRDGRAVDPHPQLSVARQASLEQAANELTAELDGVIGSVGSIVRDSAR
jgi:murein DD-endopeptidase MepM/ murein hydrolase activator NlpD